MERENAWKSYSDKDLDKLEKLSSDYIEFISENKTERECVNASITMAEKAGYKPLAKAIKKQRKLKAGDKVYAQTHGKALILAVLGTDPLEDGFNILGAHIDSPRLDAKQNPLYENTDIALLDTHYYGGIKKYQWVTLPLAIHGVIALKAGRSIEVRVGEDPSDPVFCISDLLPHLGQKQMEKNAKEVIDAEDLDVIVGSRPLLFEKDKLNDDSPAWEKVAEKEPVKASVLKYLAEYYGIEEEDFLSAEIEVVPAGPARDCGLDRSLIMGYGHDDRVCAYPSMLAQINVANVERTSITLIVDKEEIGSVGATGMTSRFFENTVAEIMTLAGEDSPLALRRALAHSRMLSSDVSAGFDPGYAGKFETKNAAFMGRGLCFNKYTGSRGKGGSNDADAEYVALVRDIMDEAGVDFQTCELGRVNAGGGGTIAYIMAKYGMNVIDSGVAVLSMHALWEVANKADIYEAYRGYKAFIERA
ncbi:MAG TPA: aminopeptidase [Collinsella aerofaciens]|nr:aminopeptidase [Collinsella aerofaciens]